MESRNYNGEIEQCYRRNLTRLKRQVQFYQTQKTVRMSEISPKKKKKKKKTKKMGKIRL